MRPYYQDDAVTLYLGDCREVLPSIGVTPDHVITDPPYSEHVHAKQWIAHALSDGDKRVATAHSGLGFGAIDVALAKYVAAVPANRWRLYFADLEGAPFWRGIIEEVGLEYVRTCIWDKVDSAPQFTGDRPAAGAEVFVCGHPTGKKRWNGGGRRNIFRHAVNGEKGAKPHPSTKPLPLMIEIISLFTDEGETILDPFAGSGTTLRAAKEMRRRAIGIEREEKWCEAAAKRLAQETLFAPRAAAPAQVALFEAPKVRKAKTAKERKAG